MLFRSNNIPTLPVFALILILNILLIFLVFFFLDTFNEILLKNSGYRKFYNFYLKSMQKKIKKFEKKYGMNYLQFSKYLKERAQKLPSNTSLHKNFMLEEEDALDWKIAAEMMQSWLGLGKKGK